MNISRLQRLALTLTLLVPAAHTLTAQNIRRTSAYGDTGATISVASLRISQKAWEHFDSAKLAYKAGRDAEFDRQFSLALAAEPRFAALYMLRASHHIHHLHYDAALADVLTAQHIEPAVPFAGVVLASIYNGMHRFDDALLTLQTLRGTDASTWQAIYESTRAYIGRHDVDQSLRASALTLKVAPENFHDIILLRANALSLAHRHPEAIEQFRLFLASNPAPAVAAQVERAILSLTQHAPAPTELASAQTTGETSLAK